MSLFPCPFSPQEINAAPLAEAALRYAAARIPVFPLVPRGKQPIVARGFYRATCDPNQIARWWQREPYANIGVACGSPSDWWVLDIDPRHGGLASLARLERDLRQMAPAAPLATWLSATLRQLTGGQGAHLVFCARRDANLPTTTTWAGYQGIDFRAEASYVVVAPSIHPSGGRYQWQNDLPLTPFPDVLVECWRASRQQVLRSPGFVRPFTAWSDHPDRLPPHTHAGRAPQCGNPPCYLDYVLSQAFVGQRNRFACYLACRLVEQAGLDWEEAVPWMRAFVAHVSQEDHPYTEREALSALQWAFEQV